MMRHRVPYKVQFKLFKANIKMFKILVFIFTRIFQKKKIDIEKGLKSQTKRKSIDDKKNYQKILVYRIIRLLDALNLY